MKNKTLLIAITGPESCGKSQLAMDLAAQLPNARSVEEFARKYLADHKKIGADTANELLHIGESQYQAICDAERSDIQYIITDTDDMVIRIWLEEVFGSLPEGWWPLHNKFKVDFTLLCSPDLPWQADPMRVNPHDRDRLFERYIHVLSECHRKFGVVTGFGAERTQNALRLLATFEEKRF